MHKEVREIVRQIKRKHPGFYAEQGKRHVKLKNAQGDTVYVLPSTPGGGRWKQNLLADLRREGLI